MKLIKGNKVYNIPPGSSKVFFDTLRKRGRKYINVRIKGKYYNMLPESEKQTLYRRGNSKGQLKGRYTGVPQYLSDKLRYLRLKYNMDLDKDGKPDLYKGQIISRVKKEVVSKPKQVMIALNIGALSGYKKKIKNK